MITRRQFLKQSACVLSTVPLTGFLRVAWADTQQSSRFVVIILRGAMDGLAAVPPYGDSQYQTLRGELALSDPGSTEGVLKLDGLFGLHPKLINFHRYYTDKQLLIVHATASAYRERSHFDGQKVLENGTSTALAARDGWLNRALSAMKSESSAPYATKAIALGLNLPLVLRGDVEVDTWAPSNLPEGDEDTLARIARLYSTDPFFTDRFNRALAQQGLLNDKQSVSENKDHNEKKAAYMTTLVDTAAALLKNSTGPQVAVMDIGGWDTHANQGAHQGVLATRLEQLDTNIARLEKQLSSVWNDTSVLVITEFGRTVAVNGTRGTDHGTGTCAFVIGGKVNGGRVIADWPGLAKSDLYQERDLKPTTDLRSICKGLLAEQLSLNEQLLNEHVFPDSAFVPIAENLLHI